MLEFACIWVAAQPSFIINNQFATTRENHLQKGDDSTGAMVIQQGGIKTSKTAILPVTLTTQFNSHHPYGYNDASFIPASGLQSQLTFGANVKVGPVKLQLQPEFIYAANPTYAVNGSYGYSSGKPYTKLYGGQSTLSVSSFSVGVSSANKWWGPGNTSALIMSNNAPGFANIFIKTHRPAKTPIGNFEFELIGGRLESDSLTLRKFSFKTEPQFA